MLLDHCFQELDTNSSGQQSNKTIDCQYENVQANRRSKSLELKLATGGRTLYEIRECQTKHCDKKHNDNYYDHSSIRTEVKEGIVRKKKDFNSTYSALEWNNWLIVYLSFQLYEEISNFQIHLSRTYEKDKNGAHGLKIQRSLQTLPSKKCLSSKKCHSSIPRQIV